MAELKDGVKINGEYLEIYNRPDIAVLFLYKYIEIVRGIRDFKYSLLPEFLSYHILIDVRDVWEVIKPKNRSACFYFHPSNITDYPNYMVYFINKNVDEWIKSISVNSLTIGLNTERLLTLIEWCEKYSGKDK